MTTLAQGQKDNKPAVLAGFILLLVILVVFVLTTFRDVPPQPLQLVDRSQKSNTSLMRLRGMAQMP
jgi:hypothetical protein